MSLQTLLDGIVDAKKGIDAAFVSDLGSGFLLKGSQTLNGRNPQLIQSLMGDAGSGGPAFANTGVFMALQQMMDAFGGETGFGNLSSTILQFGEIKSFNGILVIYVYRLKSMSLAIGFVNSKHDGDILANVVFHCEKNIKDVLKEVYEEYGP